MYAINRFFPFAPPVTGPFEQSEIENYGQKHDRYTPQRPARAGPDEP